MKIIDATDQKQWDGFITAHPEANFLQSWAWGEFHLSRGKTVVRRLFFDKNKQIVAAYVGQVETAKRGAYLAIAGGPIMDWQNRALCRAVFDDIRACAASAHCVFVRVRPQIRETTANRRLFADLGLKPAPFYLSVELAGVLDLNKSDEELSRHFRCDRRRALRKAIKNNLTVTFSEDPRELKTFYEIQHETAERHRFVEFSEDFLTKQFTAFAKYGQVRLYTAKKDDAILAQGFIIFYGDEASYHYGASTALGTRLPGASLMQWQAIRDARAMGKKRYNFWGITAPHDTKHRFYGVSQFKRSFGAEELQYLHAHDLILRPFRYRLDYVIEKIRARVRHV